jgi:thiamine biosynthesis lipoprotein
MMGRRGLTVWGVVLGLLSACGAGTAPAGPLLLTWEGRTMGTTYMVKIAGVAPEPELTSRLQAAVEKRFGEIKEEMSHYAADSELSRFNNSTSQAPIKVSAEFAKVIRHSLALNHDSGGAFDPTLGWLIDLWGFGPAGRKYNPPTDEAVRDCIAKCGAVHLKVTANDELQKDLPELKLNLSAVAKGYGADEASLVLRELGYTNVFVSVCGEIVAFGTNAEGQPWRVGVEQPVYDLPRGAALSGVVSLSNRALSTSGDAYNYFKDKDGRVYSHILDPAVGRPARHKLASVTVIAPNGLTADGLATTLFVMGPERGLAWIEHHPEYAALFIVRTGADQFKIVPSTRFPPFESIQ